MKTVTFLSGLKIVVKLTFPKCNECLYNFLKCPNSWKIMRINYF